MTTRVTSPQATGGAGPAFETKVGAACLTLLLTRGAPLCLGAGTLRAVHLQAGHLGLGWRTDDFLLETKDAAGKPIKAALQAKRTFIISASNEECVKTLRGALADFRNATQFDQVHDVIGLVTSSLSAKVARGLRTLLDCARASTSATDMARRLAIPDYLGKAALGYHKTIQEILAGAEGGAPSEEELWRFLSRFRVVDLDLNVSGGLTETLMRSLLAATLPDADASAADATWNELVTLALSEAGGATSYTREKLPSHLLQRHGKTTGFSSGVSRLIEDTKLVVEGVRTNIAGKVTIPRRELLGELCRGIEHSPLVFVTGAAGSGKSALVKLAFAAATEDSVSFAFRAVSLAGHHINEVLHRFGLTLAELQAQTAMHARKVLWVDSLERLMEKPADQRAAFLDLLRALKGDPTWRLVVTCRDYSAETIRTAFFTEAGLTPVDIDVGDLSDSELDEVATDFPSLERPLSNPSLRGLLRNAFFLDKAAKMNWLVTEPLPVTERAFREKVWSEVARRVDEDVESGLPNLRGKVLAEVALRRAKALEPFVAAGDLDPRALARLVRDSLLQTPAPGSELYALAHDVFEDWALMRWLDEEFERHGRKIDSLVDSLGTYPALRRAYRRWLTEALDADKEATDPLVLSLIQNPNVAAHWREDTLVGVLQSRDARGFLHRNVALLLGDGARLLRQVIHILRVACRAAIPRRSFGVNAEGEFFLPKGNGWVGAGELMEIAIPSFTEADLMLIVGFLEDWVLLTRFGLKYPKGARSIARVAWHWLPRIPWRSPVRDAEERLLRVILAIPLAAEPDLSKLVEEAMTEGRNSRANESILKLIFNHFACDAVVRDLPDMAFRVAEHLLGLDRSLEEVVADRSGYSGEAVNYAFGLGTRFTMDDFPASAYHGPYLRMLWNHPDRAVDFILRLTNRACEASAHPENEYEYIEPPGIVTLRLPDGTPHEQYANGRLWGAYRGMSVAPYCFQSALMALEHWLLEKAKRGDADVEALLVDLLRRSNNVAVTAVVASIAAAYHDKAKEAGFALLTCPPLLRADLERSVQESFHAAQMGAFGLGAIDAEKRLFDNERAESGRLPHRSRNLEYVAVVLQMLEPYRQRVGALIDAYKSELPPEAEQDRETKLWRIQLHRIDTRNFVQAGRTEEGHIIIGSSEPEPDLQELIEQERPRSAARESAMGILNWGRAAFEGRPVDSDKWREHLAVAKAQIASRHDSDRESDLTAGGPAYVAAVCIRDHWPEMTSEEQEWCAQTVCDAVEADADVTAHLHIVARNPMEGSRPAAFILSALFDKALPRPIQQRLLSALAKAVIHAVEETVSYAVQGIGRFLWRSDRALALTCIQALVINAVEKHAFVEKQRQRPFLERVSEESFEADLRSRLRRFIAAREPADEAQIIGLDLARWPGRSVFKHLFAIATQQPCDPMVRKIMRRCIAVLPVIWEANERSRHGGLRNRGDEERYDPHLEHDVVDATCRFVLELSPDEALGALTPVFAAASRFPEHAADVVTWLVLHQGDRTPAPTLWALWQRFADDFSAQVQPARVDEEHSEEAKLLRELFLGINWADQRDWLPLHGETSRLRALFQRLPPMEHGFECYGYYLAKAGTPTLPDALVEVASKLDEAGNDTLLNETAVFYLEEILTRLIYGGNVRIRAESGLRRAALKILDALVEAGSSPAYKLRDDFLTPMRIEVASVSPSVAIAADTLNTARSNTLSATSDRMASAVAAD